MRNPLTQALEAKFTTLEPLLDERARRLWAAVEARALGRGGILRVAEATGLSRGTIRAGLRELDTPVSPNEGRPPTGRLRQGLRIKIGEIRTLDDTSLDVVAGRALRPVS